MMDTVIQTKGLARRFGKVHAVDGLDLEVPRGSVFGFIGRNGAGKTTTVRMLLGLLPMSAGSATVLGRDARKESFDIKKRVGYVPEIHHFYQWMSIAELTRFTSSFYPTWQEAKCTELLKNFELDPAKKIKELSKGMVAKVALTLALAHDPGGSALFIRDSEGVIRVGVAQFAHGGGGVALHGPGSKGAAVLYFQEAGSLTFYDPDGNPTMRLPEAEAEDQGHSGRSR